MKKFNKIALFVVSFVVVAELIFTKNITAQHKQDFYKVNEIEKEIKTLETIGIKQLGKENQSIKIKQAKTTTPRSVVFQPEITDVVYQVKYDEKEKWHYIDAFDFGVDPKGMEDATSKIQLALKTANEIIMTDGVHQYQGVAVKLSGKINIERPKNKVVNGYTISDYDQVRMLRQHIPGVLMKYTQDNPQTNGIFYTQEGVRRLAILDEMAKAGAKFNALTIEEFEKIKPLLNEKNEIYIEAKRFSNGKILGDNELSTKPSLRYKVNAVYGATNHLNQIKIDKTLSNVVALYGDGIGLTRIQTNLIQDSSWNSEENDTDARNFAVVLIDGFDGFVVKDLTIAISDPAKEEFYKAGQPYYGKVMGIQVNEASHVSIERVEVFGANRAGVNFSSIKHSSPQAPNTKETAIKKAMLKKDASDLVLPTNNKLLDSNLHHNRVAGVMYGNQKNILIEGNILASNGHIQSGGTGYGSASEAGSYLEGIVIRNNQTLYNFRKGTDIHDGNHILIENNISIGDRLFGISVYNRAFAMEYVLIRNNKVIQDPNHRLYYDDTNGGSLLKAFKKASDYAEYSAIYLETDSTAKDLSATLSKEGKRAYFEIKNNEISNLKVTAPLEDVQKYNQANQTTYQYKSRAIFGRMNEAYLDYVLNVENNTAFGESMSGLVQFINNSNEDRKQKQFETTIGNGSGTILVRNNKFYSDKIVGAATNLHSPLLFLDYPLRRVQGHPHFYQDKFRGEFIFENNHIQVNDANLDGKHDDFYTVPLMSVTTNAQGLLISNNIFDIKNIKAKFKKESPYIKISGLSGPRALKPNMTSTSVAVWSNIGNTLKYTQPLLFVGNRFKINQFDLHPQTQIDLLHAEHVLKYAIDNHVETTSTLQLPLPIIDQNGKVKLDTNDKYNRHYDTLQALPANQYNDSAIFNLQNEKLRQVATNETINTKAVIEKQYRLNHDAVINEEKVINEGSAAVENIQLKVIEVDNKDVHQNGYRALDANVVGTRNYLQLYALQNIQPLETSLINGMLQGDYQVQTDNGFVPYTLTYRDLLTYHYAKMPIGIQQKHAYTYASIQNKKQGTPKLIEIGSKTYQTETTYEAVPIETVYQDSSTLQDGEMKEIEPGSEGLKMIAIQKFYVSDTLGRRQLTNGKPVNEKVIIPMKKRIILRGVPKPREEIALSHQQPEKQENPPILNQNQEIKENKEIHVNEQRIQKIEKTQPKNEKLKISPDTSDHNHFWLGISSMLSITILLMVRRKK